jgi:hypothetical protein
MYALRSLAALKGAAAVAVCALASLSYAGAPHSQQQQQPQQQRQGRVPKVQIAILLDNSGSMSGLINQARSQIWKVVNEFSSARQNGVRPRLELALYEYGETVRRLSPFTTDLDHISEQLFGLGIRGGDEHCGQVIQAAVNELEWSGDPDDLKLIYIAGNEPFTQGPVDYRSAIASAKRRDITVNPIHCGGDEPSWKAGAMVAGVSLMTIDHNAVVAHVAAPQDAEIARLGAEMNKTYLGYGAAGAANSARQSKEDSNAAAAAPGAMVTRAVAKSSAHYDNSGWDLVDGTKNGTVKVEELKDEQLPQELRGLTVAGRKALIEKKAKEREEIQKRIQQLSQERERYVAAEMKKQGEAAPATLDAALVKSAWSQAEKKAFTK